MINTAAWKFSLAFPITSPKAWLIVEGNQFFVTSASFEFSQPDTDFGDGEIMQKARQQLQEYLAGDRIEFDVPVMSQGSEFQLKVWTALEKIPLGQTQTYGDMARELASSARAVGSACRENPVAVIVPCHRVVSKQGIGGYAGETSGKNLQVKSWLLAHEA